PVVHLAGFGLEDTHSVANGLVWGPDGWIYGGQGSTTTSRVLRPGLDPTGHPGVYFEGCMVWRYHPVTRTYEIFAEGSGNVFGLEVDGEGRLFSGHNGPETHGWHYQQGGIYLKQGVDPGKFGPPRNPYTFGELPWLVPASPIQRFTHFLALVEGTALPSGRQGQMVWLDPIHSLILASERTPRGSTYGTRDLDTLVTSGDDAFRPVFVVNAPDGSLFVADFYEHYIAHGQHYQGQIDPTTGRIYRLRGRNARLEPPVDLTRLAAADLIQLFRHPNKWHRQAAVRALVQVLTARKDTALTRRLRGLLQDPEAPAEILWTLHQAGALDAATAQQTLRHSKPLIREWTVRLLGDPRRLPPGVLPTLRDQIMKEPDVRVRAQMASSARRLPLADALVCWKGLVSHDVDATDPCQPLLCWWILESHMPVGTDAILDLFTEAPLWDRALVREHVLPRLMRRLFSSGRREDLDRCGRLLGLAPSKAATASLVRGLEEALRGQSLDGLPETLLSALDTGGLPGLVLRIRRRDAAAIDEALLRLKATDPVADRLPLVRALGEIREPRTREPLQDLALGSGPSDLRRAACVALGGFEDEGIGVAVTAALPGLPEDVRVAALGVLGSRATWSRTLLRSLDSQKTPTSLITSEVADSLRNHRDPSIRSEARRLLPEQTPTRSGLTAGELERILGESTGNPYAGEPLFAQRCGACHRLFFKGGQLGPDLTAYQRDNLRTLLPSILDPNAEIREGYAAAEVSLKDGRVLQGILRDRDGQVVVLRGLDGQDLTLRMSEVESVQPLGRSLMPEGLLEGMTDTQKEKFTKLIEAVDFNSVEEFNKKANIIKETYFTKS
ncbi:MAG: dehydrogenase, partial [Verrucomicrobiota bacterium]